MIEYMINTWWIMNMSFLMIQLHSYLPKGWNLEPFLGWYGLGKPIHLARHFHVQASEGHPWSIKTAWRYSPKNTFGEHPQLHLRNSWKYIDMTGHWCPLLQREPCLKLVTNWWTSSSLSPPKWHWFSTRCRVTATRLPIAWATGQHMYLAMGCVQHLWVHDRSSLSAVMRLYSLGDVWVLEMSPTSSILYTATNTLVFIQYIYILYTYTYIDTHQVGDYTLLPPRILLASSLLTTHNKVQLSLGTSSFASEAHGHSSSSCFSGSSCPSSEYYLNHQLYCHLMTSPWISFLNTIPDNKSTDFQILHQFSTPSPMKKHQESPLVWTPRVAAFGRSSRRPDGEL